MDHHRTTIRAESEARRTCERPFRHVGNESFARRALAHNVAHILTLRTNRRKALQGSASRSNPDQPFSLVASRLQPVCANVPSAFENRPNASLLAFIIYSTRAIDRTLLSIARRVNRFIVRAFSVLLVVTRLKRRV